MILLYTKQCFLIICRTSNQEQTDTTQHSQNIYYGEALDTSLIALINYNRVCTPQRVPPPTKTIWLSPILKRDFLRQLYAKWINCSVADQLICFKLVRPPAQNLLEFV